MNDLDRSFELKVEGMGIEKSWPWSLATINAIRESLDGRNLFNG